MEDLSGIGRRKSRTLNVEWPCAHFITILQGLEFIHSEGVIHFDLKPDNILIDETGRLKISDFGMATRWPRVSAEQILAGSGLGGDVGNATGISRLSDREGDRVYMAPEMLRGDFTAANDVFR